MNEQEWVKSVVEALEDPLRDHDGKLEMSWGTKLPYAHEIRTYSEPDPDIRPFSYETDILVKEHVSSSQWTPRLIIEAKLDRVTTHDAITYSQKAFTHKTVHPYLRYGILIGNRGHFPLPGRLVRHGAHFDFMLSMETFEPSSVELRTLLQLIGAEVTASRHLEEILYESRKTDRKRYWCLHRRLELTEMA